MRADGSEADLRRALVRKGLAFDELRRVLADEVNLRPIELLALQYLAHAGTLTPGELGMRLVLSSGGSTALVQRLDHAGAVLRQAHPDDRRSMLLQLAPEIHDRLAESLSDLVEEIDETAAELSAEERRTVVWFLDRVAELSEGHTRRLRRMRERNAPDAARLVRPALWA